MVNESVRYSLRNLSKRKGRSFLTLLSIFIGVATIFIFISFGWGLYDYVEELTEGGAADKFIVQDRASGSGGGSIGETVGGTGEESIKLNDDQFEVVESTRGVKDLGASYMSAVKVKKDEELKYSLLFGSDPDKLELMMGSLSIELEKGRNLEDGDLNEVVLGHNYLEEDMIFSEPLDLNDKIEVNDKRFDIVGFYESAGNPTDDSNIYVTKDTYEKIFPEDESYSMFVGSAKKENLDEVVERVKKELRNERDEEEGEESFTVESFSDRIEAFSSSLNIIVGFVILVALISVLVSAINTANTMITSVLERFSEIGIIKAVGGKNIDIFKIFLFESSFLGFIAGIIGVSIGFVFSYAGGQVIAELGWGFLTPNFSWMLFAGCIIFSTLVGGVSGVWPAYQASKLKPTEALRYE